MVEHQHTYNTIQYIDQRLNLFENIFQKSTNQQQELPVVDMFVNGSGRNEQSLQRAFHSCYLSSFGSFGQAVSEEKIVYESANQQHELPVLAMFVNRSKISNLYRGPSIDATYHVSVHLAKQFRSRRFVGNLPINNTNCLCWPCLLTDPKLAIFIEGLPQMLPTTFRFIWSSGFRVEDFFRNRPISNKNCLCLTCLLRDQD